MQKLLFIFILILSHSTLAETELCQALRQQYVDSKRFYKKKCKKDNECELADLKWNSCIGLIGVNKEFFNSALKHFSDLRLKAYSACNTKVKSCERRADQAVCYLESCESLNSLYDKDPDFKVYFKFEGSATPLKEIILRREHRVYCITAPCPPLVEDTKLKLVEGVLKVSPTLVPYGDISGDIQYFFIAKGYDKVYTSRKKLIELKNQTIEMKLSKK